MSYSKLEVKIEDKDYIYTLELHKFLRLLGVKKTDEEIINAIKETIRRT